MKTVSAAQASRGFSKLLRDVQSGEVVTITSRGKPVARMGPWAAPVCETTDADRERDRQAFVAELRSRPALNVGPIKRDELYDD